MPIKKSASKKYVGKNISELTQTKVDSKKRRKGIATLAKRKNISKKKAQHQQAIAIALETQRKAKKGNIRK